MGSSTVRRPTIKAETYYTMAYASHEKGAIENCNRIVRRIYPKGTDFNQLTRRDIQNLENWINWSRAA